MIYLDYAATTPMSTAAIEAYRQAAERYFGNSSSLHDIGSEARRILDAGRRVIAARLGVPERGLFFTGSGSEASFLTITSLVKASEARKGHLITTRAEHSSVRNTFSWLEEQGYEVTRLSVSREGQVRPEDLRRALREDTLLVSIQHVNPETGAIQPLQKIGEILKDHPARFHSDMVQSFCKLPTSPDEWHLDALSISAHKIHGPKGIGAAWIRPSVPWQPFLAGTTHESGFRPGTVNVPAVAAFAAAVNEAALHAAANLDHVRQLRELLIDKIASRCGDRVKLAADRWSSSPYVAGLVIQGMEGQYAMLECSQQGLAISTGSACQVNEQKPSATLLAMGYTKEEAMGFIRLSFDGQSEQAEVERAADILASVIEKHHASLSPL